MDNAVIKFMQNFFKVNSFLPTTLKKYWTVLAPLEKIFDCVIPILFSTAIICVISLYNIDLKDFIDTFLDINTVVISAIAILVGFNIASIAVISTSQSDLVNQLKKTESKNNKDITIFEILIIYFTWSILIQLLIILIGMISFFLLKFLPTEHFLNTSISTFLYILLGLWFFLILHSIFVSFRNIKMLYIFINHKL